MVSPLFVNKPLKPGFLKIFTILVSRCPIIYWRSVQKELQKEWRCGTSAKQYANVAVTGDRSKVWCFKEQYCIGTWNVRSMNEGKLEVVKQEMASVIIDILGISQLKWTGMGEFNSGDHDIYFCGQESLRRNGVAIMVNKSLTCSTWMQSQKRKNDLCSFLSWRIQYHGNPSLCPNQKCWRSWSWMVLWRPTRPFRTNIQKRCPFHYRGLECKRKNSRNTWSNRQIWLWNTEMKQGKG